MRIFATLMLSGAALGALSCSALADGTSTMGGVDVDKLAATAAPVIPAGTSLLAISKTPQPVVPGLPLTAREKAAFGPTANTITLVPAGNTSAGAAVSWSGYTRAGVVYHGSN